MPGAVQDIITYANFVKIGKGVLVWRGVEFWPFPLICIVTFKTTVRVCDSLYRYSSIPLERFLPGLILAQSCGEVIEVQLRFFNGLSAVIGT